MRKTAAIVATATGGALCGVLLGFPWAARIAALAPLTLLPLLYTYRRGSWAASIGLSALYTAAALLVGLEWIYAEAAAHQGPGDYYTSFIALIFECFPSAIAGFAAWHVRRLTAIPWSLAIASLWTTFEFWRATTPLGVPYVQMGHALIDTPLAGLAGIGGTEALTFLCIFVAALLYECSNHGSRIRVLAWTVFAGFVAANALLQGAKTSRADGGTIAVLQLGMVNGATFSTYLVASRTLPPSAGLAIWPESELDLSRPGIIHAIQSFARARHAPTLVGGTVSDATGVHDALELIGGDGNIHGYYAKRQLIPFGEYLPLPALAHVLVPAPIVATINNLIPGSEPVTFGVNGRSIGPLICYESAFPNLDRDEVRRGASILVAASNDAWFTQASGVWELEQTARLVAIETGTPLVLSGTVGPSGVIDANGRWTGSLPIGTRARAVFRMPPAHKTLYDVTGDLPWIAVAIGIAVFGLVKRTVRGGSM